jgi:hypothetical protein
MFSYTSNELDISVNANKTKLSKPNHMVVTIHDPIDQEMISTVMGYKAHSAIKANFKNILEKSLFFEDFIEVKRVINVGRLMKKMTGIYVSIYLFNYSSIYVSIYLIIRLTNISINLIYLSI